MKAVIIGAGVCGPVTAMALQRAGIDAVVYQAHGPGDRRGLLFDGRDQRSRCASRHRRARCVLTAGFPTPWNVLFSGAGKRLGRLPISSTRAGDDVSHTIRRPHLHRALHEEAGRRGVHIEFGKRLVSAETTGAGVRALF